MNQEARRRHVWVRFEMLRSSARHDGARTPDYRSFKKVDSPVMAHKGELPQSRIPSTYWGASDAKSSLEFSSKCAEGAIGGTTIWHRSRPASTRESVTVQEVMRG